MAYKFYHNPNCSKSRNCLKILEEKNTKFETVLYMKNRLTYDEIEEIINKLLGNLTSIIRDSNKVRINYKQKKHELIKFISENPNQLQRPIFFNGKNYIICRPPEKVLEFL
tara:strand:- start:129 stop:461 length:333 start_codon:yes stop_codon:yes gene_type:complete